MRKWQVILVLIVVHCESASAQFRSPNTIDSSRSVDTSHFVPVFAPKSLAVQFLVGEVSFEIPAWLLVYRRAQAVNYRDSPDLLLMLSIATATLAVPVMTNLTLKWLGWQRGDVYWGAAGSVLGMFVALLVSSSPTGVKRLFYSGIPSVLGFMLFYDLSRLLGPPSEDK